MFDRSFDLDGDRYSGDMSAPATVSNFRFDKYEVTVGRFGAFVASREGTQVNPPAANVGAHATIAESGWDTTWNGNLAMNTQALVAAIKCDSTYATWTDAAAGNEDRPMNCITWYEAMAFCAWDGGFLPTEAEWNYAATDGNHQRAYPWSNPPGDVTKLDSSYASYSPDGGTTCVGDGMPGCAVTDLVPVGTKPAGDGRWGQSDLAGNVLEWTLDWDATYTNKCMDCANLTTASNRVLRGGSFFFDAPNLRASYRNNNAPSNRFYTVGMRCARTP